MSRDNHVMNLSLSDITDCLSIDAAVAGLTSPVATVAGREPPNSRLHILWMLSGVI